jgi:hypothetical protein
MQVVGKAQFPGATVQQPTREWKLSTTQVPILQPKANANSTIDQHFWLAFFSSFFLLSFFLGVVMSWLLTRYSAEISTCIVASHPLEQLAFGEFLVRSRGGFRTDADHSLHGDGLGRPMPFEEPEPLQSESIRFGSKQAAYSCQNTRAPHRGWAVAIYDRKDKRWAGFRLSCVFSRP